MRATVPPVTRPQEVLDSADSRPDTGMETTARPKVIYLLYTGDMYGTEQMAITHLRAVQDKASVLIVAPDGPLHAAVGEFGIPSVRAETATDVFKATVQFALGPGSLTVLTASLRHSLIGLLAASLFPWKRTRHFNICHGGTDLVRSYGRKRVFNKTPIRLVAVSAYCAVLLRRFGVPAQKIVVVDNFLADERFPREPARRDRTSSRLRVVAVTRLVGIKRTELLIEALKLQPMLVDKVSVTIVGAGELLDQLSSSAKGMDVTFTGFRADIDRVLAESDIFVQTCAVESFGLAVAEAMAAGVMVVSPDEGGAAEVVGDERYGLLYKADDAAALAAALVRAVELPDSARATIAAAGAERAREKYSSASRRPRLLEVFFPVEGRKV